MGLVKDTLIIPDEKYEKERVVVLLEGAFVRKLP